MDEQRETGGGLDLVCPDGHEFQWFWGTQQLSMMSMIGGTTGHVAVTLPEFSFCFSKHEL